MDRHIQLGIFAAIVFICTAVSGIMAASSGIATLNFITLTDLGSWVALALSPGIVVPALLLPLAIGAISAFSHSAEKKDVYIAAYGGAIPAALVLFALLGIGFEKVLIAVFFLISLAVLIETGFVRKEELKSYVTFRTASESAKKMLLIAGIGLVFAAGSVALANNERSVEVFGEKVIWIAFSDTGQDELSVVLADALIDSQKQTVDSIISSPAFLNIAGKNDTDVQVFVASMNELNDEISSPETRQRLIDEMRRQQAAGGTGQPITFDFLRRQSPMIGLMADYYWLINTFALVSLFMFVSNLLLSNLAGAYAAVMRKILEAAGQSA